MTHKVKRDTWKKRRSFMFVTVAFCMIVIAYVLWAELKTGAAESAVSMAFVIIGTTVASYVFGAAWEDIRVYDAKVSYIMEPVATSGENYGEWEGSDDDFKGD